MGGGLSTLPAQIDKQTFRALVGGAHNDAIFDENSVAGIMTRDRLLELSHQKDTFLSHEWGLDDSGRDIGDIVAAVKGYLSEKGIHVYFDTNKVTTNTHMKDMGLVGRITSGVDQSKASVCFLTRNYIQKVYGPDSADKCHLEFNYILKRKHPNLMIPVILEECLLTNTTTAYTRDIAVWVGPVELALGGSPYIDFTAKATNTPESFSFQCEQLFHRIYKITRKGEDEKKKMLAASIHSAPSGFLSQINKTKEEQQFFQWMARSTNIDESRRLIYCTALVRHGVSTVFTLAKMMGEHKGFLLTIGMNEYDADQVWQYT
jgi:hypothetical protein